MTKKKKTPIRKPIHFHSKAYVKNTRMGNDGEKFVTLEFSTSQALEVAKLELMSRDLRNHIPVLLDVSIGISNDQKKRKAQQNRYDFTR